MGTTRHVFDYLESPDPPGQIVAVFGDDSFLKRLALDRLRALLIPDEDVPLNQFEGESASWSDVRDALRMESLFQPGGTRVVVVREADPFVKSQRQRLEEYVARPDPRSVLILEVGAWASNTRLYKLVDQHGLQIECRAPQIAQGRNKVADERRIIEWLIRWAKQGHRTTLTKSGATLLVQLVGPEFGLLDQELAKLALFTSERSSITETLVKDVVGGWRAKTSWDMIDAALDGDSTEALRQLDLLLQAGEPPQALFGSISWSLRRFAAATRLYQRAERARQRLDVAGALQGAGFSDWPKGKLQQAQRQLKQLGRDRASQFNTWLLETDLALKGSHSDPDLGRIALERLLLRLDGHLRTAPPGKSAQR